MGKETKDLDDFFNEQPTPERKVKIHTPEDAGVCTSCEG